MRGSEVRGERGEGERIESDEDEGENRSERIGIRRRLERRTSVSPREPVREREREKTEIRGDDETERR